MTKFPIYLISVLVLSGNCRVSEARFDEPEPISKIGACEAGCDTSRDCAKGLVCIQSGTIPEDAEGCDLATWWDKGAPSVCYKQEGGGFGGMCYEIIIRPAPFLAVAYITIYLFDNNKILTLF
jgi:hypothetical protein